MNLTADKEKQTPGMKTVVTAEMDSVATTAFLLHQQTKGKSVTVTDGKNKCEIRAGISDDDKDRLHAFVSWGVQMLGPILKDMAPKYGEPDLPVAPGSTDLPS